jgi:hypothetical protein
MVAQAWANMIDPGHISGNAALWIARAIQLIEIGRNRSALMAYGYAQTVRRLQAPADAPAWTMPALPALPLEQIQKSLGFVGPARTIVDMTKVESMEDGTVTEPMPVEEAMAAAEKRIVATVERHVHNGGRDAIDAVVREDRAAVGWIRVTDSDPCYFCAMLASRGPVYLEDSFEESDPRFTGPGDHKVHDSCGCQLRPLWTRSKSEWTPDSVAFLELWKSSGAAKGGKNARLTWRQAYEGRAEPEPVQ